ncbi:phosphatidate cytidylyltransferase [Cognatiyoonia sp. IB215446]|uniref:phosphatidate cytidylyltransferase n=1 Tax=Cognatiyoonia sp. IB215446 TaxID=3097355 RepID=UPI002A114099|nr:phosphatidate cytidylyltransferase [Cognatiyoonia sp. IB215446]MDX8349063.1 phosphatidate cytidylyltransferase [Cognatiyoonia sp. IB215446]
MTPPPANPTKWDDLTVRIASSAAMVVFGAVGVILGGVWFQMMVVFVSAVMIWELWMMIRPQEATKGMLLAALAASVMSGQLAQGTPWGFLLFLIVPLIGITQLKTEKKTFFVFALGIQVAGWGLVHFRVDYGFTWLLWLMSVVIVTDIFGYFAGKAFGGPKFWPRISPKKTWSGTVAGWIGAGIVGFIFTLLTDAGVWVILISMILSFAGQMGDIAESALKRRMGVKDSSTLIPGHGGLFDRFDALLGASLFLIFVADIADVPGVVF